MRGKHLAAAMTPILDDLETHGRLTAGQNRYIPAT
jgi:hypothetical protein